MDEATVSFFEELMQLLHPFMPFITEEIYHLLKEQKVDLCVAQTTKAKIADRNILANGIKLQKAITAIRDTRKKNQIKNSEKINFSATYEFEKLIRNNTPISELLIKQTNTELSNPKNIAGEIAVNLFD